MIIKSTARSRFVFAAAAAALGIFSATPGHAAIVTMTFTSTAVSGATVDGIAPIAGLTAYGSLSFDSTALHLSSDETDELKYTGPVTTFTANIGTSSSFYTYTATSVDNFTMSKSNYPGPNQYFEADAPPLTTQLGDGVTLSLDSSSSPLLFSSSADPGSFVSQHNLYGEFSLQGSNGSLLFDVTMNISAVPEPSTWAMMVLGFLGIGLMAYRKRDVLRFA